MTIDIETKGIRAVGLALTCCYCGEETVFSNIEGDSIIEQLEQLQKDERFFGNMCPSCMADEKAEEDYNRESARRFYKLDRI